MSRTLDDVTISNIKFIHRLIAKVRQDRNKAADFVVGCDQDIEGYLKILDALEARDNVVKPVLLMRDRG